MTVSFRNADVADAEAIGEIFRSTFCDTFGHLYRHQDLEAFLSQFTLQAWRAELADEEYALHVAETGSQRIGYAKLGPLKLPVEETRPAILLSQLYVVPEHQGAGIAHRLMDWVVAEAKRRGKMQIYLTVFTENHRARRFYDRQGFGEVGPYQFMVGDHADEDIIMRRSL